MARRPVKVPAGSLRLFVAIELAPAPRAALCRLLERLRGAVPTGVRWVAPANLHVTVQFLGEVAADDVEPVRQALEETARSSGAFDLRLLALSAFPTPARPRVVHMAVETPPRLAKLAVAVNRALVPLGFPKEKRPFAAHVTLGRVKRERGSRSRGRRQRAASPTGLAETLAKATELHSAPFAVTALTLFASTLGPGGPTYRVVHRFPLGSDARAQ